MKSYNKKITVSINPTYLCNFRCDFCYLTPKQLSDKSKVTVNEIDLRLKEISNFNYEVDHVDLYGGEIALLSQPYLEELDQVLQNNGDPTINIITNLSKINPFFLKEHVDISVSFDFDVREKSDLVLNNILQFPKPVAILMLASKELIKKDVDLMIKTFNSIRNIKSVEIKPYSSNQANSLDVSNYNFEEFISKWLHSAIPKNFEFTNQRLIEFAREKRNNSFSDDHVYITPSGKFSVLEFDQKGDEYFLELDNFQEYLNWTKVERERVSLNPVCSQCEYLGHCLTEHYREVNSLTDSCNGFLNLITRA